MNWLYFLKSLLKSLSSALEEKQPEGTDGQTGRQADKSESECGLQKKRRMLALPDPSSHKDAKFGKGAKNIEGWAQCGMDDNFLTFF